MMWAIYGVRSKGVKTARTRRSCVPTFAVGAERDGHAKEASEWRVYRVKARSPTRLIDPTTITVPRLKCALRMELALRTG